MISKKLIDLIISNESYNDITDNIIKEEISNVLSRSLEDNELKSSLNDILQASHVKLRFNPFFVEKLMVDCIDLVKSLIQQRNNVQNLEILLMNNPLSKRQVDMRRSYEDKLLKSEKDFKNSSKVISKQWKLKLGGTTSVESDDESSAEIAEIEANLITVKEDYIREKRDLEDLLIENASNEESGLNFLTRYVREKQIYYLDFVELYSKLISPVSPDLQSGLIEKRIFNTYYSWMSDDFEFIFFYRL